jgi:hypothetical protein
MRKRFKSKKENKNNNMKKEIIYNFALKIVCLAIFIPKKGRGRGEWHKRKKEK